MKIFPFLSKPKASLQHPLPTPPALAKSGTVILTFNEVAALIPAVQTFGKGAINATDIGLMYDTLRNSTITPPAPWALHPCRFDHLLFFPSDIHKPIAYFVFYPL